MRRVTVFDHVTLDGVMQAPGRADEDCRDDFRHGGWSPPYGEEVMGEVMGRERRKYVASRTLQEPLTWSNSTLLEGDAADAVEKLKREQGKDIVILGSGELIRALMARGLVDAKPTTTGVIIATYATS